MCVRGSSILAILFVLAACGSPQKPPPLAEERIDNGSSQKDDTPQDNGPVDSSGGNGTTGSISPGGTGSGKTGGPQPIGDSGGDAGASGGDAGAKKSQLTDAECKKVVKKLADLTSKEAHQPLVAIADLDTNPVYGQMLTQCSTDTTKKQYTCAMNATKRSAWETCMK